MNQGKFSGFANQYEQARPLLPKHAIDLIQKYLLIPMNTAVDLGCGTGLSTLVLKDYAKSIIGVEPNLDMHKIASQKANHQIQFIQGSGENIPLEDQSVELVICSQAFHWTNHLLL